MASFAASLLDELMGRDRDADPNNKRGGLSWDDPDVCKYYLCGFCPHDLFTNTRADLGACDKIHEEEMRNLYKKSSRFERLGYEEDFVRFLQSLIADVERRIRRGQSRLTLNIQSGGMPLTPQSARDDKIEMLTERINELVEQAEQLGCEGKVEEAQGVMKLCDQLKEERTQLENTKPLLMPAQKEMEVCHVCGAFQIKGDALSRMEDHLSGRQHRGYAQCRTYVEEHKAKVIQAAESERERIAKEQETRDRELDEERERRRQRDRERGRDRDERRRRSRSRDRHERRRGSRERRRSRSRERRRSRSRDRRRSRSRERRSRSRDRRSRRSSSRGKRSRSRDRRERSGRSHRDRDRSSREKSSKEKSSHEKKHTNPNGLSDEKVPDTSAELEHGQGDNATVQEN